MRPPSAPDPLLETLGRLPPATPDAAHDDRVRQRCHAALAERRRGPSYRFPGRPVGPVESLLVGAFGILYLVAVMYDALRVYRQ